MDAVQRPYGDGSLVLLLCSSNTGREWHKIWSLPPEKVLINICANYTLQNCEFSTDVYRGYTLIGGGEVYPG